MTCKIIKTSAYQLPFSKRPEDIVLLFNMLQCIDIPTGQNCLHSEIRSNIATSC